MTAHHDWARERAYYAARTMRALELLAFGELSSNELAETLGVHPRTARRLLTELAADEYLIRGGGRRRRFRSTLRLAALGRQAIAHAPLPRTAAPWVASLAAQTGQPAGLWIPSYTDTVCILASQPAGPPPQPQLGELAPAHASAPGKALLAHRAAWRDSLLARPLHRHTDRTLTDPRDLLADLARVRTRGYATDTGEHHQLRAIAAPIFVADDAPAALSTTLNAHHTDDADLNSLAATVISVAAALSAALNDTGP
jgi:IclR family transcriptional regulator, acetate operon repressor